MSEEQALRVVPASSIQSSQKSTIIKKGNARPKKGLGAKRVGGLGAQKANKIDFAELEKSALEADRAQMRLSVSSSGSEKKQDDKALESSRKLAYQDIERQEKQIDKKLLSMDEKKKQQAERLGMGMGMGRTDGVSHSMKMMTISQETPHDDGPRRSRRKNDDIFYDAKSSNRWMDDDDDDDEDNGSWGMRDYSYKPSYTKSGVKTKPRRDDPPPSYTIEPIEDTHKNVSSVIMSNTSRDTSESSRHRKGTGISLDKYSGAKAISSDMVFGDQNRSEYERDERLRNMEGRSAISSSDVFGNGQQRSQASYNMPDLGNLKEGVRSVAGKMSSVMSGIANTIQDRYGT